MVLPLHASNQMMCLSKLRMTPKWVFLIDHSFGGLKFGDPFEYEMAFFHASHRFASVHN